MCPIQCLMLGLLELTTLHQFLHPFLNKYVLLSCLPSPSKLMLPLFIYFTFFCFAECHPGTSAADDECCGFPTRLCRICLLWRISSTSKLPIWHTDSHVPCKSLIPISKCRLASESVFSWTRLTRSVLLYQQVAPATNAHGNSNSTQYPKPGSYGSSYGSGYDGLSASQDYSKGGGGYAGGHSAAQAASKAGVGTNAPSTGSSATDIYNKTHVTLSKVSLQGVKRR